MGWEIIMKTSHLTTAISMVLLCITLLIGITGCQGGHIRAFDVAMTNLDNFTPATLYIEPGDIVIWTNNDTKLHAPMVDSTNISSGGPNSDRIYPNGVPVGFSYSWDAPIDAIPGTKWFYHCRLHGVEGNGTAIGTGMVGVIVIK
jgi:plastocyanin